MAPEEAARFLREAEAPAGWGEGGAGKVRSWEPEEVPGLKSRNTGINVVLPEDAAVFLREAEAPSG